jgi:hypothetical protein
MLQLYGATPPEACRLCEYGRSAVVSGNEIVCITSGGGGGVTIRNSDLVLDVPTESLTRMRKEVAPTVVARPENTPDVLIVKPSGKAPVSMFQLYGPTPPDASSLAL